MAFEIDIKIIGAKNVLTKMYMLRDFFRSDRLRTILEDSKNRIVFIASRLAPKGESRMLSQIHGRVENFGTDKVNIRVGTPARYGAYVEFGTRPHTIAPVNRKAMFWYQYSTPQHRLFIPARRGGGKKEIGGVFTFRSEPVRHPGFKARPFMRPAVEQVQPRMAQAILKLLNVELAKKGT
jgi:hypothetical protein